MTFVTFLATLLHHLVTLSIDRVDGKVKNILDVKHLYVQRSPHEGRPNASYNRLELFKDKIFGTSLENALQKNFYFVRLG